MLRSETSGQDPVPASIHHQPRRLGDRPGEGGAGEQLGHLDQLLDRVVEAARQRDVPTWKQVSAVPAAAREEAHLRVWDHDWDFTPQDVAGLPEEPGVYRFLAGDGTNAGRIACRLDKLRP